MSKVTKTLMATAALMLCVIVCQAFGLEGGGVELVKDGNPMAEIVLAKDAIPATKLAATDFQKHIKLISGAELPIVDKPGEKTAVYVGDSEYTRKLGVTLDDIKNSGYKIVAKDNYVVLAGRDIQQKPFPMDLAQWQKFAGEKYNRPGIRVYPVKELGISQQDDTGSLYATSDLLEQLGVRWYMPYDDGTVIPNLKDIVIKNQDIKKETNYKIRTTTFYWGEVGGKEVASTMWLKHLKYGNAIPMDTGFHGVSYILGKEEQRREHPEYFAMANGKIINEESYGKPRLTNPEFRKSTLNYIDKLFQACPEISAVWLGMPDGFGQMDERDAKLFPPAEKREAMFSEYVWDYWLWVSAQMKKTHPDKYLGVLVYTTYQDPPPNLEKVPDNVILSFTFLTSTLSVPHNFAYADGVWNKWLKLCSPGTKIEPDDQFLFYSSHRLPRYPVFFSKLLQKEMQKFEKVSEARFNESEAICPGLNHMVNYWQAKLLWDPYIERDATFNEYYELYYGPAKAEMKEFYEFGEAVWMRPESRFVTPTSGFLKKQDIDRYFQILAAAREKAGKGTVYDRRIAMIEDEMQPLRKLFSDLKRTGPELVGDRVWSNEAPLTLDGDLSKPFWNGPYVSKYKMRDLVTGETPSINSTTVKLRISADYSNLFIGVECNEKHMDKLVAKNVKNDTLTLFDDDAVEVYIETPERSFFKIAVNPNGAIWDETQDVNILTRDTLPGLWNPGVKAAVKKYDDRWTVEIVIPTADFGKTFPSKQQPWGINVCRMRFTGGVEEASALSPTGKDFFADLTKLAGIWFR